MLRGPSIYLALLDENPNPMSLITVSYTTAAACIKEAFRTKSVPYLKGSPGTGKSAIYAMIAEQYKLKLIDLRLASYEPTDLLGFPHVDLELGKASYIPFDSFPLEGDPIPDGYNGFLLLLDEINQADRAVIKAAYKIVLDRMVGPFKLHEMCYVAMAGNLDTDNALTEEMGTAMQSRISPHMILEVNVQQWLEWANAAGVDYRVTSFVEFRPDLLHHFEPDHVDCTYPCPRTWEKTHKYILGEAFDGPRLKDIHMPLIAGTIGSGATIEFIAFTHLFNKLPNFNAIMTSPEHVEFDDSPDVVFALTGLLAQNASVGNIDKILTFIDRLGGDFQALVIKNIRQRKVDLTNHQSVTDWLTDNANLLAA